MTPLHALVGFAGWTLLLIACVFLYRSMRFLQGTPINHWPRGAKPDDDAPVIKRLEDAHANSLENLPIFAVIVLAAAAMNRLDALAMLAPWVLYARVGQTLAHLWGTGRMQVFVRANFWFVQVALFFWMIYMLLRG